MIWYESNQVIPNEDGEYLGFHSGYGYGIFRWKAKGRKLFESGFGDPKVTHWAHLPEKPYTEENESRPPASSPST